MTSTWRIVDVHALAVQIFVSGRVKGLRHLTDITHVDVVLMRLFSPLDVIIERIRLLDCV